MRSAFYGLRSAQPPLPHKMIRGACQLIDPLKAFKLCMCVYVGLCHRKLPQRQIDIRDGSYELLSKRWGTPWGPCVHECRARITKPREEEGRNKNALNNQQVYLIIRM